MKKVMEIPNEFRRLFDSDWREAAVYGGRYSLKSHTVARFLIIKALQEKCRIGCFRELQNSIADSSHQLLADLISQYSLDEFHVTDTAIINKVNYSDFIFKGLHRNEQSIKSIEGIKYAWVEEAQTVSEKSLEVLTPTVREPGSQIIYTYNRLDEEDPIHKRLVIEGRPNTLKIKVDYTIAVKYGFLSEEILAEIEDDKQRRPQLFKHKWLGEPEQLTEERIFNGWKQIDEIPHNARLERRWLDFGFTNDFSAIGELWYYDSGWILNETLYRKGMKNSQLAGHLANLESPGTLIIADSAEPKSIAEIADYGLNIVGVQKKVKGEENKQKSFVKWSIDRVQSQPISYTKTSVNIDKEHRNYLWMVDKSGKILNEEDPTCENHHMAGVRYVFTTVNLIEPPKNYWERIWEEKIERSKEPLNLAR